MFQAEIENSIEDASALIELYKKRYKSEEITNYVYSENEVFLTQEKTGLKSLLAYLEKIDIKSYSKVEDLASEIDNMIRKKVEVFEDPEAIYAIVSRKLKKILNYLNMKSDV
jgi:hypothetical protein